MGRLKTFDEARAVDAAIERFWCHGYEATSVRDLARDMGIGGASLYNAFGDKRALFARALERYADRSSRARIARLEASGQAQEAIAAFLAEIIERSLSDRERKGCLLVNSALDVAPHDADLGKVVAGYLDEIRAFFRRAIERGQAARTIAPDLDAEEIAGHLLGVLLGIRVLARTRPDRASLERIARPALRLLDRPKRAAARRRREKAGAP
jgi:TetR/AcrR family transcriptional repressor of nem operon